MNPTLSRCHPAVLACCLLLSATPAASQELRSPVERSGYALTLYDSLQTFVRTLAAIPGVEVDTIARSEGGRSVVAIRFGGSAPADTTRLRILLFAQQHGDEPSGMEALSVLAARFARGTRDPWLRRAELTIIPQMNPDGAALGQRRTATGVDQNRSHLLLSTPEVRGLHDLFLRQRPHVTVDVHEYGALSESWVRAGVIRAADVQLGLLTNPNVPETLRSFQSRVVLPHVATAMERAGFSFHEYIVGSPETRIRHSTTEINDGRQSFGIRQTLAFIQEGRQGETLEHGLKRRVLSQVAALEALLGLCAERSEEIRALVEGERADGRRLSGRRFALAMEHVPHRRELHIPVYPPGSDSTRLWQVTPYHGTVRVLATEELPAGYIVPDTLEGVLELLASHGIDIDRPDGRFSLPATVYLLDTLWTEELEEQPHLRVGYRFRIDTIEVTGGHRIVRMDQEGALLIATLLEPGSIWGLSRYDDWTHLFTNRVFPIARLTLNPAR